jgi:hypothetical protein
MFLSHTLLLVIDKVRPPVELHRADATFKAVVIAMHLGMPMKVRWAGELGSAVMMITGEGVLFVEVYLVCLYGGWRSSVEELLYFSCHSIYIHWRGRFVG